jgi:methylated-DNA-protein-cysteine methyltransferase-like protein
MATDPGFVEAATKVIAAIPLGEVVTYGEVADEAGYPGASRAVGRLLATSPAGLPWWRVVTASGRLVPGHERNHARLLRAEGVRLNAAHSHVRMAGR